MGLLDKAKFTNLSTGNTKREQIINDRVNWFVDTDQDAPEYELIKVGVDDSIDNKTYESLIYQNSSYKELVSKKTIIFAPGTPESIVFTGQYIRPQRQGDIYMLVASDKQYETKLKGTIDECTEVLRWYDEDGVLREYPIVIFQSYAKNTPEDRYMYLTSGEYQMGLPQDENTTKLQEGDAFIINHKHKYRISGFNDAESSTFMTIEMDKFEEDTEYDNYELGIANYENRPVFTIESNPSLIEVTASNTVQLSYTLLDKNNQESDKPVVWSSSDESIATVDTNGLVTTISNGTVQIKVEMEKNSGVFSESEIVVTTTPSNNFSISVDNGDTEIIRTDTQSYTWTKYDNSIPVLSEFDFSIDSATTADSSDYEFTIINDTTYSIKCITDGESVFIKIEDRNSVLEEIVEYKLKGYW